jgi:hypothetical protein
MVCTAASTCGSVIVRVRSAESEVGSAGQVVSSSMTSRSSAPAAPKMPEKEMISSQSASSSASMVYSSGVSPTLLRVRA